MVENEVILNIDFAEVLFTFVNIWFHLMKCFLDAAIAKQLVRDEATGKVIMRVVGRMQRGESFGVILFIN